MNKQTLQSLEPAFLKGKRVMVRVDYNVPFQNGVISDDSRIRASLPTLNYLITSGAKVILVSHLGQPKAYEASLTLSPISKRLSELLERPVFQAKDCVGTEVETLVSQLKNGELVLLENVRFHPEETQNTLEFAQKLAKLADIFVQEAFGTVHRAHASTAGVAKIIPGYAGFLVQKELHFLDQAIQNPKRPLLAIIGGSKVSSKIGILQHLLGKVDALVIGGGMAFTFMKAQGFPIGKSLCENDKLQEAATFLEKARNSATKVILPVDQIVVSEFKNESEPQLVSMSAIPDGKMGVDAGPETIRLLQDVIQESATILWNGPLGVFEMDNFAKGTNEVAAMLASSSAITIVGGGDSAAAVAKAGLADKMTHISTGGGASLEFLEGRELPGLVVLEDSHVPVRG